MKAFNTYTNPIIHADYSDPDVIQVDGNYYMVASSFAQSPGLPVLNSVDMVHWNIIGHAIQNLGWPGYELPAHGRGVWAPSLRYVHKQFMLYFGSPDEGLFVCTAKNPSGPWTKPHCIKDVIGWIDPCPFWDDDGQAYLVNAFANSRIGFKSMLRMNRMSPDGMEVLPEGRFIFDGQDKHHTIEGPKMYKRRGWYYIFAPAGGVATGWQVALRSQSPWGPWEDKIILQENTLEKELINGPHQGAWFESPDGASWFAHFQDKGAYGRVVHLQPLRWENDWPIIGSEASPGYPVKQHEVPVPPIKNTYTEPQTSDRFETETLGLQWQWQGDMAEKGYHINKQEKVLCLHAAQYKNASAPSLLEISAVLGQKFPAEAFRVCTTLNLPKHFDNFVAGLAVMGRSYEALTLSISAPNNKADGGSLQLVHMQGSQTWDKWAQPLATTRVHDEKDHCTLTHKEYRLELEVRAGALCELTLAETDGTIIHKSAQFQAKPGLWIGATFALFCISQEAKGQYAEFGQVLVETTSKKEP